MVRGGKTGRPFRPWPRLRSVGLDPPWQWPTSPRRSDTLREGLKIQSWGGQTITAERKTHTADLGGQVAKEDNKHFTSYLLTEGDFGKPECEGGQTHLAIEFTLSVRS